MTIGTGSAGGADGGFLQELVPLGVVDDEDAPIGEPGLCRLDRIDATRSRWRIRLELAARRRTASCSGVSRKLSRSVFEAIQEVYAV